MVGSEGRGRLEKGGGRITEGRESRLGMVSVACVYAVGA